MTGHTARWRLLVVLLAAAATLLVTAPADAGNANPGVAPPGATPYGKTYGEWSAAWWQWALGIPAANNPLLAEGAVDCGVGQAGPVWFLAGVLNTSGTADRTCAIPAGTALFFPIVNGECSVAEGNAVLGSPTMEADLRQCASSQLVVADLAATVDGVALQNLAAYRAASPLYTFTLPGPAPADNVLGLAPGPSPSVADGYYLLLAPLPAGPHTIRFGGTFTNFGFTLDITYHLTVAP